MMTEQKTPPTAGEFIRQEREARGIKQVELAALLGKEKNWLSRIELGKVGLKVDTFKKICAAIGVDPETQAGHFFVAHEGNREVYTRQEIDKIKEFRGNSVIGKTRELSESHRDALSESAFQSIPAWNASGKIWTLSDKSEIPPLSHRMFDKWWLVGLTDDVDALAVAVVDGSNIESSLKPGDDLLVDTSVRRIGREALYLIRPQYGDDVIIRRCWRDIKSGGIVVEEPVPGAASEDRFVDADLEVLGRAVWVGRRI